jgi:hypothetical protein
LNDQILFSRAAIIFTFAGAGKSVGAIYIPTAEMVPEVAFPPRMPFTLQVTEVLLAPVTAAVSCRVFPSNTLPLGGVTATVTVGGGGGGEPELAPPPPQPGKIAKAAINPNSKALA